MKYTKSKRADKKIESDLEIIKQIITKKINPISIILFGGFGKGEGSFEIVNNKVIPLNDYDLYVITKEKIKENFLEKIGLECSKAIGRGGLEFVEHPSERYDKDKFFHVDIRCLTISELKKLLPTQRTAELKYAAVIYGKDIRKEIPKVNLPVSEAIRLLFNKMDHLLLAHNNTKEIKTIYAMKGFLDSCTALLIFHNRFKPSYSERAKEFYKLKNIPKELKRKVRWATNFKFYIKFSTITNKCAEKLWQDSCKWVGWTFRYIITRYLNVTTWDWKRIARVIYKKLPYVYFTPYLPSKYFFPLQYILTIKFFFEGIKNKEIFLPVLFSWRDAGIKVAIPLMLYLYNEKKEAKRYLKKITLKTEPLKERILKIYSIYYLQKLI